MPIVNQNYIDFSLSVEVEAPHVQNFPPDGVTFSFWLQYRVPPDRKEDSGDSGNDSGQSDQNLVAYCFDPDQQSFGPSLYVQNPANMQVRLQGNSVQTGANLADGSWHHVAITLQNTDVQVWRDGELAGNAQIERDPGLNFTSGGPLALTFPWDEKSNSDNDDDGGGSPRFTTGLGSIAHFRVWNGVRTKAQIQVEMSGFLLTDPNLILYWPLNNNGQWPSTVADASGNHNDGRLSHMGGSSSAPVINGPLPLRTSYDDLSNLDIRQADVHGIQLQRTNLTGALLSQANLSGASFSHANLTAADFTSANLQGADLTGTTLNQTNFSSVDLTQTTFDLQPAWGGQAVVNRGRDAMSLATNLQNATVNLATLGANWSFLSMTGCHIADISSSSDLSGITMNFTVFHNANFAGYHFYNQVKSQSANFDNADLAGAQFNNADLTGCSLQQTILYNSDLSWTTLTSATMRGALLGGLASSVGKYNSANMSYAYMPGINLSGANLYGVNLDNAQIYDGVDLSYAHLDEANLASSNLCYVDFTKATLQGVTLTDALLIGASLGADFSPTAGGKTSSLAGAHLEGADFTNAKLFGTSLAGAEIALAPGSIAIQRLDAGGNLIPETVKYEQTVISAAIVSADDTTVWPDGSQGTLSDPGVQLVAPDPPKPPECIPGPGKWCPKKKK